MRCGTRALMLAVVAYSAVSSGADSPVVNLADNVRTQDVVVDDNGTVHLLFRQGLALRYGVIESRRIVRVGPAWMTLPCPLPFGRVESNMRSRAIRRSMGG